MAKILLHACCGPCSTACVERLKKEGHEVTLFFSQPGIAPADEYNRRLEAIEKFAKLVNVPLIVDTSVTHKDWLTQVAKGFEKEPEDGIRCKRCFAYNLARAASYAKTHGFDAFTTSLTVSKYKNSNSVFLAGEVTGGDFFLKEDFKENDGTERSNELSKEYGLYMQKYCGCEFSIATAVSEED